MQIALLGGFGVGFLALGVSLAIGEALQILDEGTIWRTGEPALSGKVDGKVTTRKVIFNGYDLDVEFVAQDGSRHRGQVEFETLFGGVDSGSEPEVRYLASDPARFALSWGQDARTYRWLAVGFFAAVGVGLGGLFFTLPWRAADELRLARACRSGAHEIELNVVGTKVDAQTVRFKVEGRSPWGEPIRDTFVAEPVLGGPFFVDEAQEQVLALVSPSRPGRALVLRETLLPYRFSPADIERIQARRNAVDRRMAGSGRT
jgi:hypothetical protein